MTSESNPAARTLRVAYLVNQYPKVSHSFIRREILALERLGIEVNRCSVRGWDGDLPDAADVEERAKTRYLLQGGLLPLLGATFRAVLASPRRWARALGLAVRLSRSAERSLPYHLVYLGQACLLREWLQRVGSSHLHAHFGTNSAEVALLVDALGGPPFSMTVHGPEEFDKPAALHLAEKMKGAAFTAAVSSYGRSQLYRWSPRETWPRIAVVHCGIEPSFHAGESSSPPSAPRLVCVGRLCEQKGQLLLVEAVSMLVRKGRAVELVLAGDGEMRGEIESLIAERGLREHVRITGWISSDAVRDEILSARALVLPSFAEGLPVVIMEAMALRRPVVSTYIAGIPELVEDGKTGWLVPAGDLDALCAALEACLAASTETLARLGEAGYARVLERHDVDREAAKLAALFANAPSESALRVLRAAA
jgi:colanic acid/amylovoran biosynthesis glycosyltransferase